MSRTLLVVDDHPLVREKLTRFFSLHGFSVDAVGNPMRALLKAKFQQYDGVITDFRMPMMDGAHLYRMLKEIPGYRQVPIILMSTAQGREFEAELDDCGVAAWLEKPLTDSKLLLLLAELIHPSIRFKDPAKQVASANEGA